MHVILIYLGIFCGIFIEGEMVMITSVIAAHHGHLNLWIVMAINKPWLRRCIFIVAIIV